MRRIRSKGMLLSFLIATSLAVTGGCGLYDTLLSYLGPKQTTVRFINNGDFAVEGKVIIGDDQETTEDLLQATGTEISFSVDAGGTSSFSRDCDEIQALLLDDANLQVVGGAGPDTRSGLLRDGSDYNCGDRITFTFDHSAIITDFDVNTSVE